MTVYKNGTLKLENLTSTPANHSDKFYVLNNEPYYGNTKMQSSQLENITEGGNTGWRLLGRNPGNYGNIGEDAVDLSENINVSATTGATGDNSLASGSQTTAFGFYSTAMGFRTTALGPAATAMVGNYGKRKLFNCHGTVNGGKFMEFNLHGTVNGSKWSFLNFHGVPNACKSLRIIIFRQIQ